MMQEVRQKVAVFALLTALTKADKAHLEVYLKELCLFFFSTDINKVLHFVDIVLNIYVSTGKQYTGQQNKKNDNVICSSS